MLIVSVLMMCVLTRGTGIVSIKTVSVRTIGVLIVGMRMGGGGGGVAPGRARAKVMCVRRTRTKILRQIFLHKLSPTPKFGPGAKQSQVR